MIRPQIVIALCFLFLSLGSCSKAPTAPKTITTLSQAQEYFLKICKEELKYDVTIIPDGKTMWVYVPINDGIINFRAASKNQAPKTETKTSWSINFLENTFENKNFIVRYDIAMTKKYDKSATYENKYSDEYNTKQREVLTALTRAYFDVGQKNIEAPLSVGNQRNSQTDSKLVEKMVRNPVTFPKDEVAPEFFVMVFADIKSGIAIKSISYFNDMKMALSNPPALTSDEYGKRFVYELFGDEDLIGDKTGSRLKTEEMTLGNFLAKQIENRIKFQFTQSGFPPTGEVQDEIWNTIAETCRLYNFSDFEKIKLTDLQTEKESTFDKSQL